MKTLRGIITNPIIIGILAGLLWSVLGIPQPKIFAATIKNIAVLATPLGLMAMGSAFDLTKAKAEVAPALAASIIKLMLLVAAFIEAFWSSMAWVPAWGKFSVSGVLWTLVFVWLWRGGHGGVDAD